WLAPDRPGLSPKLRRRVDDTALSGTLIVVADAVDVVRRQFDAYRRQDAGVAESLLDDGLRFTSPQDDHIDKRAFMEGCFPTAERFVRQEIRQIAEIAPGLVVLRYVYELQGGATYSNVEFITVQGGRVTEIRVYFGGPDRW